jgi:hypothetical protein
MSCWESSEGVDEGVDSEVVYCRVGRLVICTAKKTIKD